MPLDRTPLAAAFDAFSITMPIASANLRFSFTDLEVGRKGGEVGRRAGERGEGKKDPPSPRNRISFSVMLPTYLGAFKHGMS